MKILNFIFIASLFFGCSTILKNGNGKEDTSPNPCVSSSADKMNLFYIGLDNPVTVFAPGFREEEVAVTISEGGTFIQISPYHYNFKPDGSAKSVIITESVKKKNNGTTKLYQQAYRIVKIPNPQVRFGNFAGGKIDRNFATSVEDINAVSSFSSEVKFTINSYTLIIVPANGKRFSEHVEGNKISETIHSELSKLNVGDIIVLQDVIAIGPSGITDPLGLTLTVM